MEIRKRCKYGGKGKSTHSIRPHRIYMRQRKGRGKSNNLFLLVLLLKKATCLHFCSQIVVISFASIWLILCSCFNWELFNNELFKRGLLMLRSLCLKVEITHLQKLVKNVQICLVYSPKCRILQVLV